MMYCRWVCGEPEYSVWKTMGQIVMKMGICSRNRDVKNTGLELVMVHDSSGATSLRSNCENWHIRMVLCHNEVEI